jgi:hypothetical protein
MEITEQIIEDAINALNNDDKLPTRFAVEVLDVRDKQFNAQLTQAIKDRIGLDVFRDKVISIKSSRRASSMVPMLKSNGKMMLMTMCAAVEKTNEVETIDMLIEEATNLLNALNDRKGEISS